MRQPNWKRWEVVLLVYMYYEIKNKNLDYKKECMRLSKLLRNLYKNKDEVFRNFDGIVMQYQNIKCIDTGCGLTNTSSLQREIVNLYKTDKKSFDCELQIINDLVALF